MATAPTVKPDRFIVSGWLTAHGCWALAAYLTVTAGRRFQDCLAARDIVNGDSGPFQYGEQSGITNSVQLLLLAGAVLAVTLTVVTVVRKGPFGLTGPNLLIGTVAAFLVGMYYVGQIDHPMLCEDTALVWPAVIFGSLTIAAIGMNVGPGRRFLQRRSRLN